MSFILDALRKSDAERQQHRAPGLADVRHATRGPRRGLWLPLIALVLVANIGVMAWLGLRDTAPAPAIPPAAPAEPAATPTVRPLAREAAPPPGASTVSRATPPAAPAAPAAAPPAARTAPSAPADDRAGDEARLPGIEAMVAAGKLARTDLSIDLHVHSDVGAKRFVVINGRRHAEGDTLGEGPKVERITPDGVVLSTGGTHFFVPRK